MRGGLNIALVCLSLAAISAPQVGAGETGTGAAPSDGQDLFNTVCASCHNEMGVGVPGLAPPLDRPEFWQALGDDAPRYISGVITKGLNAPITVRGERYAGLVMVPLAGNTDEDLAHIATWVLGTLGKTEGTVTPELVAEIRGSNLTIQDLRDMRPDVE